MFVEIWALRPQEIFFNNLEVQTFMLLGNIGPWDPGRFFEINFGVPTRICLWKYVALGPPEIF